MSLSKLQKDLIDRSWRMLRDHSKFMFRFYDHLFRIAPETIHFFPDDITKQSEKLSSTIGFLINNLNQLHSIKETIQEVGRFHNRLQIEPEHYNHLKVALLETIKEAMEEKYTLETGQAWESLLDYVSTIMLNAPASKQKGLGRFFTRKLS